MPKIHRLKKTARRPRNNSAARKGKQKAGRKRSNGTKPTSPKVISNSVFALTLPERAGIEIQELLESNRGGRIRFGDKENYKKIYSDLLAAFHNAYRKVNGEFLKYDPLKFGFPIARAIAEVIDAFRLNIVPPGYDFNVHQNDYDDRGHYFVIYKIADEDAGYWTMDLEDTVLSLKKQSKSLHDTFISFISSFWKATGMNMWFEDEISGYVVDMLEEEILNWEEYRGDTPEDLRDREEAIRDLESYRNGEMKKYEQLICKADRKPAKYFTAKLKRFSNKNPIVKWMKDWAELIDTKYKALNFDYSELREEEGYEDLRFTMCFTFLWDSRDAVGYKIGEHLECDANNMGVAPPVINVEIKRDTKVIDLEWLKEADRWPNTICSCMRDLYKAQKDFFNLARKKK